MNDYDPEEDFETSFDQAKKLSDFIGMVVRVAFSCYLAAVFGGLFYQGFLTEAELTVFGAPLPPVFFFGLPVLAFVFAFLAFAQLALFGSAFKAAIELIIVDLNLARKTFVRVVLAISLIVLSATALTVFWHHWRYSGRHFPRELH